MCGPNFMKLSRIIQKAFVHDSVLIFWRYLFPFLINSRSRLPLFGGFSSENLGFTFSALYLSNSTIRVTGPFHSKYYIQWFKGPKCNILASNVLIFGNFLVQVMRICCVRGNNHCWWKIQKGAVKDPLVIKVFEGSNWGHWNKETILGNHSNAANWNICLETCKFMMEFKNPICRGTLPIPTRQLFACFTLV